jgi:CO/xanthine dehydrogenase FAD-binding subunit
MQIGNKKFIFQPFSFKTNLGRRKIATGVEIKKPKRSKKNAYTKKKIKQIVIYVS